MNDIYISPLLQDWYRFLVFQSVLILSTFLCGWLFGYWFFFWKLHRDFDREERELDKK